MSPERFRTWVSAVLIVGVSASAALISIGFVTGLAFGWTGSLIGAPGASGAASDFSSVGTGLIALRPIAIAQAGLLFLIATPVFRVAVSLVAFALERDRLYAAITAAVLTLLLLSLFVVR